MINAFVSGAVTVQFETPPLRQGGDAPELFQVEGRDSLGTQYIYDKGAIVRTSRRLVFPRVSTPVLEALLSFSTNTVRGAKTQFTWYDHEGAVHTVRLIGKIEHQEVGPARHRVELSLEEDTAWAAPSAGYSKDSVTGAAPVWILKLTVGGVNYYLSDMTISIASWEGGITTKPWVAAWGSVQEGISNSLSEIRVSDFSLTCLIAPDSTPSMETLATEYVMEANPAELYLWFRGQDPVASPPVMKFRGYVKNIEIPDNTTVSLVIEDETVRLGKYIGTKIDRTAYPSADPDDVGRIIPIPYGSVSRLPALALEAGIQTSIPANISSTATSFPVSDATGLAVGQIIQADDEQMLIQGISGDTLTVQRGVNGTIAASHLMGAVTWQRKNRFVYVVADCALDAIPKVYGRVGEAEVDITAVCTRYLGTAGNQLAGYEGRAVVTVPGYVTIQQAVALLINDGVSISDTLSILDEIGILDGLGITDGIGVDDLLAILDGIGVVDGIGVTDGITLSDTISLSNGTHSHTYNSSNSQAASNCPVQNGIVTSNFNGISGVYWRVNFAATSGTRSQITFNVTVTKKVANSLTVEIWLGSTQIKSYSSIISGEKMSFEFTLTSGITGDTLDVFCRDGSGLGNTFLQVDSASRTIQFSGTSSGTVIVSKGGTVSKDGSVTKSGSASKSGTVTRSGAVSKTGTVTRSGSVSKSGTVILDGSVTKSGTVTLSGNSVANTLVGDIILCDVVRNVTAPGDVVSNLLSTYCDVTSFQQVGAFPASYAINGAITEYRTALEWLNTIAFQCRAWFRMELGTAQLIVRPDALTPVKTIPACRITGDGRRVYRRRKAPYDDIINKINLLFDRDWSKTAGDDAYSGTSKGNDAVSIANYGERERPELFLFDFITTQAMADDVRAFYLTRYAVRKWLHEFETYLEHSELKFSDAATLGFAGSITGEIIEAGHSPGSTTQIDAVKFTVLA